MFSYFTIHKDFGGSGDRDRWIFWFVGGRKRRKDERKKRGSRSAEECFSNLASSFLDFYNFCNIELYRHSSYHKVHT